MPTPPALLLAVWASKLAAVRTIHCGARQASKQASRIVGGCRGKLAAVRAIHCRAQQARDGGASKLGPEQPVVLPAKECALCSHDARGWLATCLPRGSNFLPILHDSALLACMLATQPLALDTTHNLVVTSISTWQHASTCTPNTLALKLRLHTRHARQCRVQMCMHSHDTRDMGMHSHAAHARQCASKQEQTRTPLHTPLHSAQINNRTPLHTPLHSAQIKRHAHRCSNHLTLLRHPPRRGGAAARTHAEPSQHAEPPRLRAGACTSSLPRLPAQKPWASAPHTLSSA